VIAIDGPVGAGKSTVARAVAQRLGYRYVDTGAMYRAVAWKARAEGVEVTDRAAVAAIARALVVEFVPGRRGQRILADGTDVTGAIRSPQISEGASIVSAYPEVRQAMVEMQRRMGQGGGVVMEGRDIGTVVFPDAEVKIYLDASLEARTRRRYEEFRRQGARVTLAGVRQALQRRDRRDTTRAHSPLRPARDAVVIDSTAMSVRQVVDAILARVPR